MKIGIIGLSTVGQEHAVPAADRVPRAGARRTSGAARGHREGPGRARGRAGRIYNPKKKTYATVEYVDVPGVTKGEGAALVDLPALRGVDALLHVVRAFESDVGAPSRRLGRPAARREDAGAGADPGRPGRGREAARAAGARPSRRLNKAEDVAERVLFQKMKDALEAERPLRELELSEEERRRLRNYAFLSEKPVLIVANLGEEQVKEAPALLERSGLTAFAARPGSPSARCRRPSRPRWRSSRPRTPGLPRGPRARGARPRPRDPHLVRAARPRLVPDRGRGRVPRLDHPPGHARRPRPQAPSTPTSSAASSAPRWWRYRRSRSAPAPSPPAATRARCGSRARSTWCATAT